MGRLKVTIVLLLAKVVDGMNNVIRSARPTARRLSRSQFKPMPRVLSSQMSNCTTNRKNNTGSKFVGAFAGVLAAGMSYETFCHNYDVKDSGTRHHAHVDKEAENVGRQRLAREFSSTQKHRSKGKLGTSADPIYKHPETGGEVYCGGIDAAQKAWIFSQEKEPFHIVDCQHLRSGSVRVSVAKSVFDKYVSFFEKSSTLEHCQSFTEADSKRRYYRFQMGEDAILRNWMHLFEFIDLAIANGDNILIHCLVGAHRAGSISVAYLMHKHGLPYDEALEMAREIRPIIDPRGLWPLENILKKFSNELQATGRFKKD